MRSHAKLLMFEGASHLGLSAAELARYARSLVDLVRRVSERPDAR
jgi:hypothetical protein